MRNCSSTLIPIAIACLPAFAVNAQSQTIIDVDSYGANGSDLIDDTVAIRLAFAAARAANGQVTVNFTNAPGGSRYLIGGLDAPLCTPTLDGKRPTLFLSSACDRLENVVVNGNGAQIINADPLNSTFYMEGAIDVEFNGLKFDLGIHPYIGGEVVGFNSNEVRIRASAGTRDPAYFSDVVGGVGEGFGLIYQSGNPGLVRVFNGSDHFSLQSITFDPGSVEHTLTFSHPAQDISQFQVGDDAVYAIRGKGSQLLGSAIAIFNSVDIKLKDLTVFGSGQFSVTGTGNTNLNVDDCKVTRKPGRMISTNGDGVHLATSIGTKITNCRFEYLLDDGIHLKQNSTNFLVDRCLIRNSRGAALRLDQDGTADNSEFGLVSNNFARNLSREFFFHGHGNYSQVMFSNNTLNNLNVQLDGTNIHRAVAAWGARFRPLLKQNLELAPDSMGTPSNGNDLVVQLPSANTVWDVITCSDNCNTPNCFGCTAPMQPNQKGTALLNRVARQATPSTWLYAEAAMTGNTSIRIPPSENFCSDEQFWVLELVQGFGTAIVVKFRHRTTGSYLTYPPNPTSGVPAFLRPELPGNSARLQMWIVSLESTW